MQTLSELFILFYSDDARLFKIIYSQGFLELETRVEEKIEKKLLPYFQSTSTNDTFCVVFSMKFLSAQSRLFSREKSGEKQIF